MFNLCHATKRRRCGLEGDKDRSCQVSNKKTTNDEPKKRVRILLTSKYFLEFYLKRYYHTFSAFSRRKVSLSYLFVAFRNAFT